MPKRIFFCEIQCLMLLILNAATFKLCFTKLKNQNLTFFKMLVLNSQISNMFTTIALEEAYTFFVRMTCCGKGLHHHCWKQLTEVESKNIREYCPLCRTKHPTTQEEIIKQLQKWVEKKKAWHKLI